ncbi:hypothetical protein Dimus_028903, partial [Dionaea muscipula]
MSNQEAGVHLNSCSPSPPCKTAAHFLLHPTRRPMQGATSAYHRLQQRSAHAQHQQSTVQLLNIAAHIQTLSEASKPITKAIATQRTAAKEPPTNKHPIHIQQAHMQLQLAANGSPPTISQCAAHLASAASIEESLAQHDSAQNNWDANVESKREELNGSSGGEQKEVELLRLAAAGSGGDVAVKMATLPYLLLKLSPMFYHIL